MAKDYAVKKKDANHNIIVEWLEGLGATVRDTHDLGGGFNDVVVLINGHTVLVEIKTDEGDLTPSEVEFAKIWIGNGGAFAVVRDEHDVADLVMLYRSLPDLAELLSVGMRKLNTAPYIILEWEPDGPLTARRPKDKAHDRQSGKQGSKQIRSH